MTIPMIQKLAHLLIQTITRSKYRAFESALSYPKETQLKILNELTGFNNYQDFINHYPLINYSDIKNLIEDKKNKNPRSHFVPTSGSTHAIKWIPYTKKLKGELWNASAAWLHDLYIRFPAIKNGTHYWSLSWLPREMRKENHNDDVDFFVGFEKVFLKMTMAVGSEVLETPTLDESMKLTLLNIINRDVTLISIWSPTFFLELIDKIFAEKDFYLTNIQSPGKKELLKKNEMWSTELAKVLFPKLALISCWATSSSKQYAEKLTKLFPHVNFEYKGLWATEGVVTIPYRGHFPLAVNSHFYEFKCLETDKIVPSWELVRGMKVSPILTTGSEFIRYEINDQLLVTDFLDKTPCLIFLGRLNSTDIVGEKISSEFAFELIKKLGIKFSCSPLCLMAMETQKPYYHLLVEGSEQDLNHSLIADYLEESLSHHFHYKLARELGQLQKAQVRIETNSHLTYIKIKEKSGMIKGNVKIEPLILVREEMEK